MICKPTKDILNQATDKAFDILCEQLADQRLRAEKAETENAELKAEVERLKKMMEDARHAMCECVEGATCTPCDYLVNWEGR